MKKVKLFLYTMTVAVALLLSSTASYAQERANNEIRQSPNASVTQTIGTTKVSINYGRPAVQERQIFGSLVPFEEVWRTGANEATTISFSDNVRIEGQPLKEGTYGLFTIPGEEGWTVIFNNVATQWGAFDYTSEEDALRVKVEPEKAVPMEQMMFYFEDVTANSATVYLHWDEVKVPFTVQVAEK